MGLALPGTNAEAYKGLPAGAFPMRR